MKKKLIQLVHIGKSQLKWDDELYRSCLLSVTGKNSAKICTIPELKQVLLKMSKAGFKVQINLAGKKRPEVGEDEKDCEAYLRKIEAIILENGLSWGYVEAICLRSVKKYHLQWCTAEELRTIVQILCSNLYKQGKRVK